MTDGVTVHKAVAYANHDGVELLGDLYLPKEALYLAKDAKTAPALVAVHGGGWVGGVRGAFQYWGPYLAGRGIALFAISYRLATKSKTFPEAVHDVLAGCNSSAARPVLSASTRRASVCSAPRRARTLRRWRHSAARNLPAPIRRIHLPASTPVSKRWSASMASTTSLRCGPPFRCRTGATATTRSRNLSARRRWPIGSFISTLRRSATQPTRITASACCSPPARRMISSIPRPRPSRSSLPSNRPAFSCGPASCPARRITG